MIGDQMDRGTAGRLARRLIQAHVTLTWEHLWPLLWPIWAIAGVFLALSLLDFWSRAAAGGTRPDYSASPHSLIF